MFLAYRAPVGLGLALGSVTKLSYLTICGRTILRIGGLKISFGLTGILRLRIAKQKV